MDETIADEAGEHFVANPDLSAVANLMVQTWPRPCWDYSAPMLEGYIRRPTGDTDLCLAAYSRGQLAGFLGYIPYEVAYGGARLPMVFGSFWTVHPAYSGQAVAFKLHERLQEKARQKGFRGLLAILEANTSAMRAFHATFRRLRTPSRLIATFEVLMGSTPRIRRRLTGSGRLDVAPYSSQWRDECADLFHALASEVSLARVVPPEDVDFILDRRYNVKSWVLRDGGRIRGLVNAMRQGLLANRRMVGAQLEHLLVNNLEEEQRRDFLAEVFQDRFWDDVDVIYLPATGCLATDVFSEVGFCQSLKKFHLAYVPLEDGPQIEHVETFSLDFY